MATPHNNAENKDIAKTVIMPGDPLRAKFIAENWLETPVLFNEVRNMYGYTGIYKGKEISVMASGMGMPSMGIYSYELYQFYDVKQIIRIGSAGAYTEDLKLYDIVLADSAWSESSFARTQSGCTSDILYPSIDLNQRILRTAQNLGLQITPVIVHSSDVFYAEENVDDYRAIYKKHGCRCVDMESFALFHNAQVLKRQAACMLTISDSFPTGTKATVEERQCAFTNMMKVALEAAL